jgi:hypothetical protein
LRGELSNAATCCKNSSQLDSRSSLVRGLGSSSMSPPGIPLHFIPPIEQQTIITYHARSVVGRVLAVVRCPLRLPREGLVVQRIVDHRRLPRVDPGRSLESRLARPRPVPAVLPRGALIRQLDRLREIETELDHKHFVSRTSVAGDVGRVLLRPWTKTYWAGCHCHNFNQR